MGQGFVVYFIFRMNGLRGSLRNGGLTRAACAAGGPFVTRIPLRVALPLVASKDALVPTNGRTAAKPVYTSRSDRPPRRRPVRQDTMCSRKSPGGRPGSFATEIDDYAWGASSVAVSLAVATVKLGSPILKRAKRRTLMFSPSLPTLVAMICAMDWVCSLMKGCSSRQNSS
jgi:hypothetical protein